MKDMKDCDRSMLAETDLVHEDKVSFRVSMEGGYMVDVITLFVEGGVYRLAGSACVPAVEKVEAFACAWRRCLTFIDTNGLKPRSLDS